MEWVEVWNHWNVRPELAELRKGGRMNVVEGVVINNKTLRRLTDPGLPPKAIGMNGPAKEQFRALDFCIMVIES